jgi:excisionase family DNA binding protein
MELMTYTVEEVAAMLGIARGKAYEHVRSGEIPSIRMGRRLLIPRARFHAWLNGQSDHPIAEVA